MEVSVVAVIILTAAIIPAFIPDGLTICITPPPTVENEGWSNIFASASSQPPSYGPGSDSLGSARSLDELPRRRPGRLASSVIVVIVSLTRLVAKS
jgi:hypothetical protein